MPNRPLVAIVVLSCLLIASVSANAVNTDQAAVDDSAVGWTWSSMESVDFTGAHGGTIPAGGYGSYGAYTFHGTGIRVVSVLAPSVTVDGRTHKMGKLKISIDGSVKADVDLYSQDIDYDFEAYSVSNLSDGNHVLMVEPDGGWADVDYLTSDSSPAPQTSTSAATADGVKIDDGYYQFYPVSAPTLCLDVVGKSSADGALLQVCEPNHAKFQMNQTYHVVVVADKLYRLTPLNANSKCVTVLQPRDANSPIPIGIWEYTGLPAEMWKIAKTSDGYYSLTPEGAPNLCLTGATAGGEHVTAIPWTGSLSQEWVLRRIDAN